MQNGQTATDGLWQGPTALTQDVLNEVRRMKLLGFNAVRLPYSMADLVNLTATNFRYASCANIAQADIIQSVTNPGVTLPAGAPSGHRSSQVEACPRTCVKVPSHRQRPWCRVV